MSEEIVGKCHICKKSLKRKHSDHWYYCDGILVCRYHRGVKDWYNDKINKANEQLKQEGVI